MKIEGCCAIVSGGNRGIGAAFVAELVAQGARKVYISARTLADAEALAATGPGCLWRSNSILPTPRKWKPPRRNAAMSTC